MSTEGAVHDREQTDGEDFICSVCIVPRLRRSWLTTVRSRPDGRVYALAALRASKGGPIG
jgi:hypothetical protein